MEDKHLLYIYWTCLCVYLCAAQLLIKMSVCMCIRGVQLLLLLFIVRGSVNTFNFICGTGLHVGVV